MASPGALRRLVAWWALGQRGQGNELLVHLLQAWLALGSTTCCQPVTLKLCHSCYTQGSQLHRKQGRGQIVLVSRSGCRTGGSRCVVAVGVPA